MKALGMIETKGLVGAIEASDVAVKTSNVKILGKHLVGSGIISIEITGDIGAVKVAIEAAVEATKRMGVYLTSNIIARPSIGIEETLFSKKEIIKIKKDVKKTIKTKEIKTTKKENTVVKEKIKNKQSNI